MGHLIVLLSVAAVGETTVPVVVDAPPGVIAAARSLGPRAAFFTSRAHPLGRLDQIHDAPAQVGTGDATAAKEMQALLHAGGVPVGGGAVDLMRLESVHHFAALFRERPGLRLFVVQARDDGREREIVERGGGVRLQWRSPSGQLVGATDAAGAPARAAGFVTSFGPLVGVERRPAARDRRFDAQEGARVDSRTARPGHTMLILHIDRDFSAGVGVVSLLFGSGVVIKAELDQLSISDGHRRYPLAASFAEGHVLELGYEVPAEARALVLKDGGDEVALGPLLSPRQAQGD